MRELRVGYTIYTEKYGKEEYQEGDLYIPDTEPIGVICLFHGGFWRMPYDRYQLDEVSKHLIGSRFIVWNIEYRRVGSSGSSWHKTFGDAIQAINHLMVLGMKHRGIDLNRVYVAGHSAGGHLAVWIGGRGNGMVDRLLQVRPRVLIGLSPVLDLRKAFIAGSGNNAVLGLMGGSPAEFPERYSCGSPAEMLPLRMRQLVIHGSNDDVLPAQWSKEYVDRALSRGDRAEYIEIHNGCHMDFIEPGSEAIARLLDWLVQDSKR